MLYKVYYRHEIERKRHCVFVCASDPDDAFDITSSHLQTGYHITGIYKAHILEITPQSTTLNFENIAQYKVF